VNHTAFTREALEALRQEFDSAFQTLPQQASSTLVNYLLLQVSGIRYAAELRQVAALQSQSRITRLPSNHPALLGVCGARSELLAVYDLAVCLGHAPSEHPAWLVRVAGTTLAFALTWAHFRYST
jgi:chemotaxis signal transduction protein